MHGRQNHFTSVVVCHAPLTAMLGPVAGALLEAGSESHGASTLGCGSLAAFCVQHTRGHAAFPHLLCLGPSPTGLCRVPAAHVRPVGI